VGIDREGGDREGLTEDDGGGFVADAREGLERLERFGDLSPVGVHEALAEGHDVAGFLGGEAEGADDGQDLLGLRRAISAGVDARAKRAGVTVLTILSVVWALRRTAMRR